MKAKMATITIPNPRILRILSAPGISLTPELSMIMYMSKNIMMVMMLVSRNGT